MKRSELQSLCETHDIPNPNRTKAALEAALLEHCCNEYVRAQYAHALVLIKIAVILAEP